MPRLSPQLHLWRIPLHSVLFRNIPLVFVLCCQNVASHRCYNVRPIHCQRAGMATVAGHNYLRDDGAVQK